MILLIFGEENFLSRKKLQQVKEKFLLKNSGDSNNIHLMDWESFNFPDFINITSSSPFLSKEKLVILKGLLSSKISAEDEERLSSHLSKMPDFTYIIFFEETESFKNKKLKDKVTKLAEKSWNFKKLKPYEVEKWVKEKIEKEGGRIERLALSKLLSFVGEDLWQLDQEVKKLQTYKNKEVIEEEDVEKLVSANLNTGIFELIDSISQKNLKKTLKFLNNLIEQGEEIVYILGMIVYQVRNLILIKDLALKNLTKSEIIKKTGKHPFVVTKTLQQIKNFSSEELEKIYNDIFETEVKIKTGRLKPDTAINLLVTKLCSKQPL